MVKLNPKFKLLRKKDGPRYVLLTGGRGSSKSFGTATVMADRACSPKHKILYTRYTMTSAGLSVIPEFQEKLDLLEVSEHFHTSGTTITNTLNKSQVIFKGIKTSSGNQTAALKSLQGITTWVLDEADELDDEDDFDTIDMSIRTKNQKNQIVLILNPTTTDHWIWSRWFENSHKIVQVDGCDVAISTHPDVLHIHFTYLDNLEHLDPKIVALWRKMKDENSQKYAHRIIGGWLNAKEGVIYDNWKEGKFDTNLPYCYGLDYGYTDPLAIIKVAVDKKKQLIYLKEMGYEPGVDDAPDFLTKCKVRKDKMIIADTNEKRTSRSIKKAGWHILQVKKGQIAADIRQLKNYTLIVESDSHNVKMEFRNYIWNDKKSETPIEEYNHLMDAMRYAAFKLIGRRKAKARKKNRLNPNLLRVGSGRR